MNIIKIIPFFAIFFLATQALGKRINEAIYGEDDRIFIENTDHRVRKLGQSVAALIFRKSISTSKNRDQLKIKVSTVKKNLNICKNQPFHNEISAAKCSAFLVAPNIVVTAGHCITGPIACLNFKFVFDFTKESSIFTKKNVILTKKSNVYACKKILHREYSYISKIDYAIIKLDRKVTDREPLKIRTHGKISDNARLIAIGHPSGMFQMSTPEGRVLKNTNKIYFSSNLDTFQGNSGGPVINKYSGLVEGILVRGEKDFKIDNEDNCYGPVICSENGENCYGEEATRITRLHSVLKKYIKD
jgi:V8-like Glu-specific endopeptidase